MLGGCGRQPHRAEDRFAGTECRQVAASDTGRHSARRADSAGSGRGEAGTRKQVRSRPTQGRRRWPTAARGQPSQDSQPPSSAKRVPRQAKASKIREAPPSSPAALGKAAPAAVNKGASRTRLRSRAARVGMRIRPLVKATPAVRRTAATCRLTGTRKAAAEPTAAKAARDPRPASRGPADRKAGAPAAPIPAGSDGGEGQSAEPLHDGDAFEQTMEHMQQAAKGRAPKDASSGGAGSQAGNKEARIPRRPGSGRIPAGKFVGRRQTVEIGAQWPATARNRHRADRQPQ